MVAYGDVAVPAAGRKQQGKNFQRLPVGEHGPELRVQPLQLRSVRRKQIGLQRRDVSHVVGAAVAGLPAFSDIGNPTKHGAELGTTAVMQLADGVAACAAATGRAISRQLLCNDFLLDRQQDRLRLRQSQSDVTFGRASGIAMQIQQLDASRLRVFRIELKNEGAAHTTSRRAEWVSRQLTRQDEGVPPVLTASPNNSCSVSGMEREGVAAALL